MSIDTERKLALLDAEDGELQAIASVNEVDFRGGIGAAIGQAAFGGIAVMASSGRTGAKPAMPSICM